MDYRINELQRYINSTCKMRKGGKRKGAGRKPAPYQTKTIAFRVRSEWVDIIKLTVKDKVKQLNAHPI